VALENDKYGRLYRVRSSSYSFTVFKNRSNKRFKHSISNNNIIDTVGYVYDKIGSIRLRQENPPVKLGAEYFLEFLWLKKKV
jgi:hypothetical protein